MTTLLTSRHPSHLYDSKGVKVVIGSRVQHISGNCFTVSSMVEHVGELWTYVHSSCPVVDSQMVCDITYRWVSVNECTLVEAM